MILDLEIKDAGKNYYGDFAFDIEERGLPNPLMPVVTPGNNPHDSSEYDFWDHLDYVVEMADKEGMYLVLHPAWGDWFSGKYN